MRVPAPRLLLCATFAAFVTACSHARPAPTEPGAAAPGLAPPSARSSAGGLTLRGQPIPERALAARLQDFDAPAGVVVLHYYGAGGWGIRWGKSYLLAAPYFTNHSVQRLLASQVSSLVQIVPDEAAVRAGFAGTPVGEVTAVLIAHGHVDHVADVPGFFAEGLIAGKPALIADRSTVNILAAMTSRFGCVAPLDYGSGDETARCPLAGMRITPAHHGHAPHLNLAGLDVAAYGGYVKQPRPELPSSADDFKLGNTWAFLIDLLNERGEVAFRIHYTDAAASPPHGFFSKEKVAERDVDLHISCVPGFEETDDYPGPLLRHHKVRYVIGGHWEDFLQPRSDPLEPLRVVLDDTALERFVDIVERELPERRGVAPLNKTESDCAPDRCGPHGAAWTLPVPGETFRFSTGPSAGPVASPPHR